MKKMMRVVGVVTLVSLVGLFVAGCGENGHEDNEGGKTMPEMEHKDHDGGETATRAATKIEQKTCPVMGNAINKDVFTDYKGIRVYFCCPGCDSTFLEDPEKYIEQMRAEGVKLEQVGADER